MPAPAWAARASDEDDEGFDVRIIAVLALPLFAISWALFNVWRVAFRQVVRQGENAKGNIMARSSSVAAPLLFIAAAAYVLSCSRTAPSFVAPPKAAEAALQQQQQAAVVSATLAAASMPAPAWAARASDEDDEGFDVRIIAVLALPLFAISWALFNVWRVAFRQVVRQGENAKGNAL
ncbi:unnamed protein product [Symbiodinium sp. KB8]|nr:unnamed protein product [Symbiodinium sp. KB8]